MVNENVRNHRSALAHTIAGLFPERHLYVVGPDGQRQGPPPPEAPPPRVDTSRVRAPSAGPPRRALRKGLAAPFVRLKATPRSTGCRAVISPTGHRLAACATGPRQFVSSSSSSTGFAHHYIWASNLDIGSIHNPNVEISITPSDALTGLTGATVIVAPFQSTIRASGSCNQQRAVHNHARRSLCVRGNAEKPGRNSHSQFGRITVL